MPESNLLKKTRKLLADAADPLPDIAAASGVGLEWLKKFRADSIPNPGVIRVQQLHDYLEQHQLSDSPGTMHAHP